MMHLWIFQRPQIALGVLVLLAFGNLFVHQNFYSFHYCIMRQIWEVWGVGSIYHNCSCDVWWTVYCKRKVRITVGVTCHGTDISAVREKSIQGGGQMYEDSADLFEGIEKCPGRVGQVDFPARQVTFHAYLHNGQCPRQCPRQVVYWLNHKKLRQECNIYLLSWASKI